MLPPRAVRRGRVTGVGVPRGGHHGLPGPAGIAAWGRPSGAGAGGFWPRAILLSAALVLAAAPTRADVGDDEPATRPGFFTRYDFHLNAAALLSDNEEFNWDADFGGELDLVDYGRGRATFVANFEAILGEEHRRYDPTQGNFLLEGRMSWRVGSGEIAGIFHHTSRHLSDRVKTFPIDWNMAGLQYGHAHRAGRLRLASQVRMLWTTTRSFVDYERRFAGQVAGRYTLTDRLAGIGAVGLSVTGVERAVFGRAAQTGAFLEAGLRVRGVRGAVEVFGGVERRIDADPIAHQAHTWALVGFRLLGSP